MYNIVGRNAIMVLEPTITHGALAVMDRKRCTQVQDVLRLLAS